MAKGNWRKRIKGTAKQVGKKFKKTTSGRMKGARKSKKYKPSFSQPKTSIQAMHMIQQGLIPVEKSPELQAEYERVSKEHFKNMPDVRILTANLPKVLHNAFCSPQAGIIVINTARTKDLEEMKGLLRHEMIHIAGIKGHGFRFEIYAHSLKAPVADYYYENKQISAEEFEKLKIEKKVEAKKQEQRDLEKHYGAKKGEGYQIYEGKKAVRVLWWVRNGKLTVPTRRVDSLWAVPKSAEKIRVVFFDKIGYPKNEHLELKREDLEGYYIVP